MARRGAARPPGRRSRRPTCCASGLPGSRTRTSPSSSSRCWCRGSWRSRSAPSSAACSRRSSRTAPTTASSTCCSRRPTAGSAATSRPSTTSSSSGRPGGRRTRSTSGSSTGCTPRSSTGSTDIRREPHHRSRIALDRLLRDLARDLLEDEATIERMERLKARFLGHPQVTSTYISLWNALKRSLDEGAGRHRRRAGPPRRRPRCRRTASGSWRTPSGASGSTRGPPTWRSSSSTATAAS